MICQAIESHPTRDGFFLDRKESSEATTLVRSGQIDELKVFDRGQQDPGRIDSLCLPGLARVAEIQFAKRMTARVESHSMREAPQAIRLDIMLDEKLTKLPRAPGHGFCAGARDAIRQMTP